MPEQRLCLMSSLIENLPPHATLTRRIRDGVDVTPPQHAPHPSIVRDGRGNGGDGRGDGYESTLILVLFFGVKRTHESSPLVLNKKGQLPFFFSLTFREEARQITKHYSNRCSQYAIHPALHTCTTNYL